MKKKKVAKTLQITRIPFGEKPSTVTLWDGCWHPTYKYPDKFEKEFMFSYWPSLIIATDKSPSPDHPVKIIDVRIELTKDPREENIKLQTKDYNWTNRYFWIGKDIYPKNKTKRIEDDNIKSHSDFIYHPIREEFEFIFDDIRKICAEYEGKALVPRSDFSCYIHLLACFVENTIVFPLKEIDYNSWVNYINASYPGDAEELKIKKLKCYKVKKKHSSNKIKEIFLSDIKLAVNFFLDRVKADNGSGIFLHRLYDSYIDELVSRKLFIKCAYCGKLANYYKDKKYCSKVVDGVACGKHKRDKKSYQKRKPEIRAKNRVLIKKLRENPRLID